MEPRTRYGADGQGSRAARFSAPGSGRRRRPGGGCWVIRPCRPAGRGRFASVPPAALRPNPAPPARPWPAQAVARSLKSLSAQPPGFGRSSPSSPRPGPTPTDRRLSFPGRLLSPVHPPRDGLLLAGSLTVQSAESEGTPVVAAGRVVPWAPRGSFWIGGSDPDRSPALAGAP